MPRPGTKQEMITTAAALFRSRGYHATSWRMLVQQAGTPWGSAYHYFPGGKEELAVAAIEHDAREIGEFITRCFDTQTDPGSAVEAWFASAAKILQRSGYHDGCRVATVALETIPDSTQIAAAIRDAFAGWEEILRSRLMAAGIPPASASECATLALVNLEGALLLSRIHQGTEPLTLAAAHIAAVVRAAFAPSPTEVRQPV